MLAFSLPSLDSKVTTYRSFPPRACSQLTMMEVSLILLSETFDTSATSIEKKQTNYISMEKIQYGDDKVYTFV